MFFSDVLDIHKSFKDDQALGALLGDSYLLQTNSIYKKIREFSLKIGCEYVEAYPRYLLLPFHELGTIVATKRIPYVPATRLMEDVEGSRPNTFSTDDVPMPQSYHLHEASHVIAEYCFKDAVLKTREEKILKTILCESFANTIDALVCVPATDDVHHFFIEQNSYMFPRKNVMQAMNRLTDTMGLRFTFMLTFFTYVHANFLAKPLGKTAIKQLATEYAPEVKLNAKLQKDIQTVCEIGERLDHRFRVTTTGNYFKQEGFEGEVFDLLDFKFLDVFGKNKGLQNGVSALYATLA